MTRIGLSTTAGRQGDAVIEHPEMVLGREGDDHPAHRRLGDPLAVNVFDRSAQPGGPFGEVRRIAGVVVLTRAGGRWQADMSGVDSHMFTVPERTGDFSRRYRCGRR